MSNEYGSKSAPSLLAATAPVAGESISGGILADLEGKPAPPSKADTAARGGDFSRLLASTLGCVGVAIAVALGSGTGDVRPRAVAEAPPLQADRGQSATVFDEPPALLAPPADAIADATVEFDPLQALMGAQARPAPVRAMRSAPSTPPSAAPAAPPDSDVDLLAALMAHAGQRPAVGGGPLRDGSATGVRGEGTKEALATAHHRISVRLAACPAANTAEGLTCRQRACAEGWGDHPACPEPSGPGRPPR